MNTSMPDVIAVPNATDFVLADTLEQQTSTTVFRTHGRLLLQPFLKTDQATAILECLKEKTPWQLHFNDGEKTFDMDDHYVKTLSDQERALITEAVHQNARTKFQYLFNNFPISDAYQAGLHKDLILMRLYEFLNGEKFLRLIKRLSGVQCIRADAQATLYESGHFLTQHDDDLKKNTRVLAYILGFTPQWNADWGGLLNFFDGDGHVAEALVPQFNSLTLFSVPQPHAVSFVTPFAAVGRYSISGWLHRISV